MSEEMMRSIIEYWTKRADSYSQLNRDELGWDTCERWIYAMENVFPDKPREETRVLDIGTGPGFFAILLAQAGYFPDAIDCTRKMLEEANKNAGEYADNISFHLMNADSLEFEDDTFDVIVNRNLTWNLEDPCRCYEEWKRVLKPGGKMVIFDANWYRYLFNEEALMEFEHDRDEVARKAITDFNHVPNYQVMEEIARQLPMSQKVRPEWDKEIMQEMGFTSVDLCDDIWRMVWTDQEKINFGSTPMFRIVATK